MFELRKTFHHWLCKWDKYISGN